MTNQNLFEKFLHSDLLKKNLISISLFITAFELLNQIIIEKPKVMYISGMTDSEIKYDEGYRDEVLSRNKSPIFASLYWLQEHNIINENDIDDFNLIKTHRNEVVHEMVSFVTENNRDLNTDIFIVLLKLIRKIEKNWFLYFEIEFMPELYENKKLNSNDAISGNEILLQTLIETAFSEDISKSI